MSNLTADTFTQLREENNQLQAEKLRATFVTALDSNPDQMAKALPIAEKHNLPLETASRKMSEIQKRELTADYFTQLRNRSPNTAEWFANPDNARIGHDQVSFMENLESTFTDIPTGIVATADIARSVPAGGFKGIGAGFEGVGGVSTDLAALLQENEDKVGGLKYMPSHQLRKLALEGFGFASDRIGQGFSIWGDVADAPDERKNYATDIAEGVGQVASQIGVYLFNPAVGTAMLIGQGADQQADRLDEQGVTDPAQRLLAQGAGAAVTYGTERIQLGILTRGLKNIKIARGFGKEAVPLSKLMDNAPAMRSLVDRLPKQLQNKWLRRSVDIGTAGGAEAAQEALEGFLQNVIEYAVYNPEAKLVEGLAEEAAVAGPTGAIARGLIMLITKGKASHAYGDQPDPVDVEGYIRKASDEFQKSKLYERSPEKAAEFARATLGNEKFYVDADVTDTLYQSLSEADQERLSNVIPDFDLRLEEARAAGVDMEISRADYFAHLAPLDAEARLAKYTKMMPEHMTLGELQELAEIDPEVLSDAQSQAEQTETEQVEAEYAQKLMDAGFTPDAARLNAVRLSQAYNSFTERYALNTDAPEEARTQAAQAIDGLIRELKVDARFRDLGERYKANSMDVLIDRARNYLLSSDKTEAQKENRRKTLIQKARDLAAQTGQPFKMPKFGGSLRKSAYSREKMPVLNYMVNKFGKIDPESSIAGELAVFDITPRSVRWAFQKGGYKGDFDGVDLTGFNQDFDGYGAPADPTNENDLDAYYVDPAFILDAIRSESFGAPIVSTDTNTDPNRAEIEQFIEMAETFAGIDLRNTDNRRVRSELARFQDEGRAAADDTLYQDDKDIEARVEELKNDILENDSVKTLNLYMSRGDLKVDTIIVDQGNRGAGVGTRAMKKITQFADQNGLRIRLSPAQSDDFQGTTSRARLVKFYKQFDFVENKGRKKDFSISEGMYRDPKTVLYQADGSPIKTIPDEVKKEILSNFRVSRGLKVGKKTKIWRGVGPERTGEESGSGTAVYGQGLYTTADKKYAKDFAGDDGRLLEIEQQYLPQNPLRFDTQNDFQIWFQQAQKSMGYDNVRDFNKDYQDFTDFIRALDPDIDGIQLYTGKDAVYVSYNAPRFFQKSDPDSNPRAQIEFMNNGQAHITLFENRNMTSLIHEEGHLYFRLLQRIAQLDNANTAFPNAVADYNALLKFAGAKGDKPLTVKQEEKMARGFEAYNMEGKAPSMELREAFQRFKSWMLRVYKDLLGLEESSGQRIQLTDEVRGVFDRMLATDEQIDALKNDDVFKISDAVFGMLTKAERKSYLRNEKRKNEKAKESLYQKALKQMTRENREWFETEREKVREAEEKLVNGSAVYRAVEYLTTGKLYNSEGELVNNVDPVKLSRKDVERIMGKEAILYLPRGITARKNGQNVTAISDMFGFSTPQSMLSAMIDLEPKADRIERQTDQVMMDRHGDMMNDGTIEREAVDAFHNDYREYVLELEAKKLAQAAKLPVPQGISFKLKADEILNAKNIREMVPYRYYRAAVSAARKAGVALGKGDFATAALEKQKQLLNHHLFIKSKANRQTIDKKFREWKRITTMPDKKRAKTYDMDYVWAARAILARYGIGRTTFNFDSWLKNFALDDQAMADVMNDMIQSVAPEPMNYRDLTWEEFSGLADSVDMILHTGKERQEITLDGERRQLDEVASEIADTIRSNLPIKQIPDTRDENEILSLIKGLSGVSTKMQTWVERMDGGKEFGLIYKALRKMISEAEVSNELRQRKEGEKFQEILQKHYSKRKIGDYTAVYEDMAAKVEIESLGRTMTREEIIFVALNYGNEDNLQKLMDGAEYDTKFGQAWDQDIVEDILSHMRMKDWQFVADVANMFESYWRETVSLERRTKGFAPARIEGRPFSIETADGQIFQSEGYYYPLSYNSSQSISQASREIDQVATDMRVGKFAFAQTKQGRVKERVSGVQEPVRLDLGVIPKAISETIADLEMREAIINTQKILNHKEVKDAIKNTLGVESYMQMALWLNDTASGPILSADRVSRGMGGLRHSLTISAMGFKVATTLLQPTGLVQSQQLIGIKNLGVGFKNYLLHSKTGPWSAAAAVQEISPFMRTRAFTMTRDIKDSMSRLQQGGWKADSQKFFFVAIQKTQQIVDTITWMGAYHKGIKDGLADDEAISYADLIVEKAQSSGMQSSLSAIERGSLSTSVRQAEPVKNMTIFYSYFNAKFNIALQKNAKFAKQFRETNFKDARDVGKLGLASGQLTLDYLMLFWVETLIGEWLAGRLPDFDDEDDPQEAMFNYTLKSGAFTMISTLPLVSGLASVWSGFSGSTGAARGVESIAQGMGRTFKEIMSDDEFNWYDMARGVNTFGVYLSPYKWPAGQLNVTLRAMEDDSEGKDVAPMDYLIYNPNK